MAQVNAELRLELVICGEPTDLSSYGIKHNKCFDDELMAHLFNDDTGLIDYIGTDVMNDNLSEEGYLNGHDVYRDHEYGSIWYDGYYCADATDYEEAEMEYWNTH